MVKVPVGLKQILTRLASAFYICNYPILARMNYPNWLKYDTVSSLRYHV